MRTLIRIAAFALLAAGCTGAQIDAGANRVGGAVGRTAEIAVKVAGHAANKLGDIAGIEQPEDPADVAEDRLWTYCRDRMCSSGACRERFPDIFEAVRPDCRPETEADADPHGYAPTSTAAGDPGAASAVLPRGWEEMAKASIRRHEGLSLAAHDVEGKTHVCYGQRVARPLCEDLLEQRIEEWGPAAARLVGPAWRTLSNPRRAVVFEVVYANGPAGAGGYVDMLEALRRGDWPKAAAELRDSRWGRKDRERVETLAARLLAGR